METKTKLDRYMAQLVKPAKANYGQQTFHVKDSKIPYDKSVNYKSVYSS